MRAAGRVLIIASALIGAAGLTALNLGDLASASRSPVLLAAMAPVSPEAAAFAAEVALAAGQAQQAEALARRSLDGALLSARALRTFGLAREAQGDGEGAAGALSLAGGLGWRDTPTQLWLIDAYVRQGDYASALERADALARRRQLPEQVHAILLAAALEPAAREALGQRLMLEPTWRRRFFETAHSLPPESFDEFEAFLQGFAGSSGRMRPDEVEGFVTNLTQQGQYAKAESVWRRYARADGDRPFGGDFTLAELNHPFHPAPFEWMFRQPPGSTTRLAAPPGRREGKALHASSRGNARYEIADQVLVLQPGVYRLEVDAAAAPGSRLEGFSWIMECLPSRRMLLPEEGQSRPSAGWTRLAYDFGIPSAGCAAQRLKLVLRGGNARPVDLWFDKVSIKPAP